MGPTTNGKSFRSTKLEEVIFALVHLFLPPSPTKQLRVTQLENKALSSAIVPACTFSGENSGMPLHLFHDYWPYSNNTQHIRCAMQQPDVCDTTQQTTKHGSADINNQITNLQQLQLLGDAVGGKTQ